MELILCRVVASSCSPTHNIVPHTSLHDPPCHTTMKKYEDFPSMVIFQLLRGNSRFKHGSVIVNNIFAYFTLSLSASQVYMIKERCLFSQSTSLLSTFHIGSMFSFFPANLMSSTYKDKNYLFDGVRISIPNWKPLPNRAATGFSQNAFPRKVLPKDDRTDSAQGERLSLPYWQMILAICVVVDESKCLDTPIWEFSVIFEHLPFLPGYKQILRQLLVCATWQSGDDIHDFCCCHM